MWDNECWDDYPLATVALEIGHVPVAIRTIHSKPEDISRNHALYLASLEADVSSTIEVRTEMLPRIIGRGGSNVRQLQKKTGAKIKVDCNGWANETGSVTVSGSPGEVDAARQAVHDIINSSNSEGSRGSGSRPSRGAYSGGSSSGHRDYDKGSRRESSSSRGSCSVQYEGDFDDYADELIDWAALSKQSDEAAKERWAKCPPLVKSFYLEHDEVAQMSPAEVAAFREKSNNIVVDRTFKNENGKKNPVPNPIIEFHHAFGGYPDLMEELRKAKFSKPTPIQAQAWPVLLRGEDLIGIAQTGTGKTLAFLLPAFVHIEGQPVARGNRGGPNVLVLAPTRELALQIEKEVGKYQFRNIKSVCLYGGGDRKAQVNAVRRGVEILIATPGRLNDLVQEKVVNVSSITYLVLDEADRMLDMGFEPQIRKVLLDIRPDRQTVMTSATWPDGVRRLAESYMHDPIQVYIGTLDLAATHTVTQLIEVLSEDEKFERISSFVRDMKPKDKVIIFCGRKTRADDLSSEFILAGISCQSIHGDREQCDREQALEDIKLGRVSILIATDVASRGLDIEDITHVVNYDFPRNIEEYVHRVGRTGRAGRTGISLSFMTRSDWALAAELIKILEEAGQEVSDDLREMATRFAAKRHHDGQFSGIRRGYGGGYRRY